MRRETLEIRNINNNWAGYENKKQVSRCEAKPKWVKIHIIKLFGMFKNWCGCTHLCKNIQRICWKKG